MKFPHTVDTSRGPVTFHAVGEPIVGVPAPESERLAKYRAEVRETFQRFSDEALAYQDARIIGGIDREECDREILRRASLTREESTMTTHAPKGYVTQVRMNDYVGAPRFALVTWAERCAKSDSGAHTLGLMTHTCVRCGKAPSEITYKERN